MPPIVSMAQSLILIPAPTAPLAGLPSVRVTGMR
jgi:hypothetical protein